MDLSRFDNVALLPAAQRYRAFLDETTLGGGWEAGAAVTTLFVEGTAHERAELDPAVPRRPNPPLEEHPLVKHYGLSLDHLQLTKAHRAVEGEHRAAAWRVMLDYVAPAQRAPVVAAMEGALQYWLSYRDGVAEACGLARNG
jgi:pyrroloquinoline-quinone synthase